jgi:hypothetical protein
LLTKNSSDGRDQFVRLHGRPEDCDRSIHSGLLLRHRRVVSRHHNHWNDRQQPVTLQSFEYEKAVSPPGSPRSQNDVRLVLSGFAQGLDAVSRPNRLITMGA